MTLSITFYVDTIFPKYTKLQVASLKHPKDYAIFSDSRHNLLLRAMTLSNSI